jgi:branched-chain amino acid transport system permease protein
MDAIERRAIVGVTAHVWFTVCKLRLRRGYSCYSCVRAVFGHGHIGILGDRNPCEPTIAGLSLAGPKAFYFFCLVSLALVLLGLLNLLRSGIGRAFLGVRDSEAASYSLGIPVSRVKVSAFALSAGVTGMAGTLLAHHTKYLTPDAFTLILSMELVLMVVIGGLGSLRGAIFGAVLISLLPTLISRVKPMMPDRLANQFGLETFVFGLILAIFVLFEPAGINGRWLKLRAFVESFPLYRKDTFKRTKRYMKSERYK